MNEKQWKIEFSSSNSSCEQAGHDVTFERSLRSRKQKQLSPQSMQPTTASYNYTFHPLSNKRRMHISSRSPGHNELRNGSSSLN